MDKTHQSKVKVVKFRQHSSILRKSSQLLKEKLEIACYIFLLRISHSFDTHIFAYGRGKIRNQSCMTLNCSVFFFLFVNEGSVGGVSPRSFHCAWMGLKKTWVMVVFFRIFS